jgi:kanamycin kinase
MNETSIPPNVLAGMNDWKRTVAWSFDPSRVTWRLRSPHGEVRYLKALPLRTLPSLADEKDRMVWAVSRLSVPQVVDYGTDAAQEWLLTSGLTGTDATDAGLRSQPERLIPLLADGLRRFHALPIDDCPFNSSADVLLGRVQQRVDAGLVDFEREVRPEHGVSTTDEAIARLGRLRPRNEDLVVCHGDYCLPNVLIDDWRVSGYVDLGRLGVADRWWDLAIATWSVTWNLGPGWEDTFLASYGIERNPDRIAFYRLLYDLLP